MGLDAWLTNNPWIFIVLAAFVGIGLGLLIALCRWWRRRHSVRVAPAGAEEERPWECVECSRGLAAVARALTCSRVQRSGERLLEKAALRYPLTKIAITLFLVLLTFSCSVSALVYTSFAYIGLVDMRSISVGDPEKEYLDQCMRDFEGLPPESPKYLDEHKRCMNELVAKERFTLLPRIRLPIDEHVCEPENLCASGDPGQCLDVAGQVGAVTACYQLIDRAKAERESTTKAKLLDQMEDTCNRNDVWSKYEHAVDLRYCMWKHYSVGVCTNSLRTSCPRDTSCCPTAQNYDASSGTDLRRPDQYVCQQSPLVGLYCQHKDFVVEGNTSAVGRELCTDVSCPNFGWCRDLADITGDCLGESCMVYQRCLELLVGSLAALTIALILEIAYIICLVVVDGRSTVKSGLHGAASALKFLVYLFCIAGGVEDFVTLAITNKCWNDDGNVEFAKSESFVKAYLYTAIVSSVGSLILSLLSVRWNSRLKGLPFARPRARHS